MHFSIRMPGFISFLLFGVNFFSFAQLNYSGLSIGVNAGTLVYLGDLTPKWYGHTRSLRPSIGLQVSKSVSPYFALRADFTHGKLVADESVYDRPVWRKARNFRFTTPVNELSVKLVFDPHGENNFYNKRKLSTYFFAGAGVSFLNIKRDWSRYDAAYFSDQETMAVSIARDSAQSLPRAIGILPVGFGLKYAVSERLFLSLDNILRLTSTDYLDGFSHGKSQRKDMYYGMALGLNYRFGNSKYDCPTVLH